MRETLETHASRNLVRIPHVMGKLIQEVHYGCINLSTTFHLQTTAPNSKKKT